MKKILMSVLGGITAFIIAFAFIIFLWDMVFVPADKHESLSYEIQTKSQTPEKEKREINLYDIKAEYNGKDKFQCEMEFTYTNKTGKSQPELYFHLFPNVFNSRQRLPFLKSEFDRLFPQGFSPGGLSIQSITQNGRDLKWELMEKNEILKVSLPEPLVSEDSVKINFKFNLTVPKANYRYGYQVFDQGKITLALAHWYPLLAMYDDGEWILDTHQALGDVTYSDVADFVVCFTVPQDFDVAASGVLKQKNNHKDKAEYWYSGEKIRDFAASISNNYETCETVVDGVKLISYFHPKDKAGGFAALNIAERALNIYNEMFGYYPYPELRIAESNFYRGGMEYPNFIMMNTAKYKEPYLSNTSFERSMAHEVAHQWWYGLVGSNQIREPWLDEGLTEFSTMCYFEKRYGQAGWESYYDRQIAPNINIINNSKRNIMDSVSDFTGSEYFPIIYVKGGLFYRELREKIGEEELLNTLRQYLETYKYKNVDFEEFWRFWDEQGYGDMFREIIKNNRFFQK